MSYKLKWWNFRLFDICLFKLKVCSLLYFFFDSDLIYICSFTLDVNRFHPWYWSLVRNCTDNFSIHHVFFKFLGINKTQTCFIIQQIKSFCNKSMVFCCFNGETSFILNICKEISLTSVNGKENYILIDSLGIFLEGEGS